MPNPFFVIMSFICMRISNHFHINSFAFKLASNRGFGQLENDLFFLELNSFKIYQNEKIAFMKRHI